MTYSDFFKAATGGEHPPYGWQERLANSEACMSRLIDIPTGLGKTAGVVLAWLWNRLNGQDEQQSAWPRRLVYCLPMRTLVEQTEGEVKKWMQNLWNAHERGAIHLSKNAIEELSWLSGNGDSGKARSPIVLMGGEDLSKEKREWDLYPERPAILMGTQDMLLSRALNRGYGMSRYRWPMHFALLNNDALWIMDEVQLMGVGVETSAQLEGLRGKLGMEIQTHCWWMSATLTTDRLSSPDLETKQFLEKTIRLEEAEKAEANIAVRTKAVKKLTPTEASLTSSKKDDIKPHLVALSGKILSAHEPGTLTLVVINRVERAQILFKLIKEANPECEIGLIHSRFRPEERATNMALLLNSKDRGAIIVATQAIEAGVDVSSRHLFTELAPWASMVQRFGRCNRDGQIQDGGTIHWIDLNSKDPKQQQSLSLPYDLEDLSNAREALRKLSDVSPDTLREIKIKEKPVIRPVLRKKDFLDLFDTTADIAGNDLDISPYIRDGEDTDVEVFWREVPSGKSPSVETSVPLKAEICRVGIQAFRSFAKTSKRVWQWEAITSTWKKVSERNIIPGFTYLAASDSGGYAPDIGWTGQTKKPVPEIVHKSTPLHEGDESDKQSFAREVETLLTHTEKVVSETDSICVEIIETHSTRKLLNSAAHWHDLGKTHYHFQKILAPENIPPADNLAYLAKSGAPGGGSIQRKHFRHELASALGWLAATDPGSDDNRDLIAYLIAAHHGRVRLSIRAVPTEKGPKEQPNRIFARGIWDGETLPYHDWPEIQIEGKTLPTLSLDLSIMKVGENSTGEASWLERMLLLRDSAKLGPIRLAFLETILRCADGRGSQGSH